MAIRLLVQDLKCECKNASTKLLPAYRPQFTTAVGRTGVAGQDP